MRVVRTVSTAVALAAAAAACATAQPTAAVPPTGAAAEPGDQAQIDRAVPARADPRVGALFLGGGPVHTCSAAVLGDTTDDLILTAAHCLVDGVDTTFVPGFPDGGDDRVWRVTATYLDPRWLADQQPQTDFAVARVSSDGGGSLQRRAGGGLSLGSAPAAGSAVTVTGYPMGDGGPLACRGTTAVAPQGFPSLPCAGLTDGFSGAPWVTGSTVTGLVGGLDGGGCDDDVSYSPRFDDAVLRLLARAEAGGPGDAAPTAFESGC
ncbi:trypsin-like serine peptidase [Mycobacterium sp. NPDC003449]